MIKKITFIIIFLLFVNFSYANMNQHGEMSYGGNGFCRKHSVYGQRYSIKDKNHAIKYIIDFYKEQGIENIEILEIYKHRGYFRIKVKNSDNSFEDEIILNKRNGRIRSIR